MRELNISNFTGGINDVIQPDMIEINQAVDLNNAQITNGAIKSLHGQTEHDIGQDSELIYQNGFRQIVQWGTNFYWSDNETGELNSTLGYFGVDQPINACTVDEGNAGGRFVQDSEYKYIYTYLTNDGFRSGFDLDLIATFTPTQDLGSTIVSNFGQLPEYVQFIEIWRTVADGVNFYKVGQVDRWVKVDGQIVFEDDMSDTNALVQEQLDASNPLTTPTEGKYLTERNGVFYLAQGDKVIFSEQSDPMSYPVNNSITFDDEITAMLAFEDYVFVASKNIIYTITGNSFADIVKQELPDSQGVKNWRTVASVRNMPVWISNDGVCAYQYYDQRSGKKISLLSEFLKEVPDGAISASSANDVYYIFYGEYTLCFDFNQGLKVYRVNWNASFGWYDKNNDQFILRNANAYYLADSGDELEFDYLSPEFTMTEMQKTKQLGRLHVDSDCDLDIDYYADGKYISSYTSKVTSTEQRRFYCPPNLTGKRLQLRFKGTGILRGYKMDFNLLHT